MIRTGTIFSERAFYGRGINLSMCKPLPNPDARGLLVAKPVEWREVEEGFSLEGDHMLSLSEDLAQMLMDELWKCGLRPSEGSGSAGSLRATERHLEDMRRLVFGAKAQPAQ